MPPGEIYEVSVTGNQTMIQIALGIDPEPLSMAPFTMAAATLPPATAADFGVRVHERAPAVLFPAMGAYVGGDIVAGLLATGLTLDRRIRLFIDVGTNSEIALGSSARALATAAPAGPAFEAAQIKCGMRAADGAIEGVKIRDGEVELTVIGDVEPQGMCGSGLVDAVAELVGAGLLDRSGRFVLGESDRFGKIGEENVFHLSDEVYLSQRDVRELQFAKASIATGWNLLCRDLGIAPEEIAQVLLAGSFGSYLSAASAVKIGLVPKLPLTRIVSAGNVAGEGAKIVALSVQERAAAAAIVEEVEYVELSGRADFNDLFVDQLALPGMKTGVVACGALALHVRRIALDRGWDVEIRALPPQLHNRPERIAAAVDAELRSLDCDRLAVAYADCGTYGALDEVLREHGAKRLQGDHCYDVLARDEVREALAEEPGTYFLTDFLVKTFDSSVARPLRLPELRDAYFANYTRVALARPGADAGAARPGRARGRDHGPAARGARGRDGWVWSGSSSNS